MQIIDKVDIDNIIVCAASKQRIQCLRKYQDVIMVSCITVHGICLIRSLCIRRCEDVDTSRLVYIHDRVIIKQKN